MDERTTRKNGRARSDCKGTVVERTTAAAQIWVRERKPKTVAEAGQLADDYEQARHHRTGSEAKKNPG